MSDDNTPYYSDDSAPPFDRLRSWMEDHRRATVYLTESSGVRANANLLAKDGGSVEVTHDSMDEAIDVALQFWWDYTRRGRKPNVEWYTHLDTGHRTYFAMRDRLAKAVPDVE